MPTEIIVLIFISVIALCMVDPKNYFIIIAATLGAFAIWRGNRPQRSGEVQTFINAPDDTSVAQSLDSSADIDKLFATPVTNGDSLLVGAMQNNASKAKESVLHRARYTSDNFRKYFDELDDPDRQPWWEDDSLTAVKDDRDYDADEWRE